MSNKKRREDSPRPGRGRDNEARKPEGNARSDRQTNDSKKLIVSQKDKIIHRTQNPDSHQPGSRKPAAPTSRKRNTEVDDTKARVGPRQGEQTIPAPTPQKKAATRTASEPGTDRIRGGAKSPVTEKPEKEHVRRTSRARDSRKQAAPQQEERATRASSRRGRSPTRSSSVTGTSDTKIRGQASRNHSTRTVSDRASCDRVGRSRERGNRSSSRHGRSHRKPASERGTSSTRGRTSQNRSTKPAEQKPIFRSLSNKRIDREPKGHRNDVELEENNSATILTWNSSSGSCRVTLNAKGQPGKWGGKDVCYFAIEVDIRGAKKIEELWMNLSFKISKDKDVKIYKISPQSTTGQPSLETRKVNSNNNLNVNFGGPPYATAGGDIGRARENTYPVEHYCRLTTNKVYSTAESTVSHNPITKQGIPPQFTIQIVCSFPSRKILQIQGDIRVKSYGFNGFFDRLKQDPAYEGNWGMLDLEKVERTGEDFSNWTQHEWKERGSDFGST